MGLDDTLVTYRFSPEPAFRELWGLSTDNDSTFAKRPISFLKKIVSSESKILVLQATPYNESPITANFDLEGALEAIQPIATECNWTLPALSKGNQ